MLQHSLYRISEKVLPCFMVEYDRYFESHDHVVCLEMFSKSHSYDVGLLLMCMCVCVCVYAELSEWQ